MTQWAVEAIRTQPAGQQFVIVVGADWSNLGMPIGFAMITPTGTPGEYSCTFYPAGPLGPNDTQPSVPSSDPFVIYVPPPPPSAPPPKAAQGDGPGHAVSWWSQTAHPGVGVLFVLPGSVSTVSSLPVGQANTPVVLFLPQQTPVAGEIKAVNPNPRVIVPEAMLEALASRSFLSSNQQPCAAITLANFQSPGRGVERRDCSTAESSSNHSELPEEAGAAEVPSREELLALASKIVKESDVEQEAEEDSRRALTLKAIAICAAVQTLWLGLRQLASTRDQKVADLGNEKRSWVWKRATGLKLFPLSGDGDRNFLG
jgi:hypothetical protein